MVLGAQRPLNVGARYQDPAIAITDVDGTEHWNVPFMVLCEVTKEEWAVGVEEEGRTPHLWPSVRWWFYEVSVD